MDSNHAHAIILGRLQPGEKLIWYDAPDPWSAARQHLFSLVFMIIWTGFILVFMIVWVGFGSRFSEASTNTQEIQFTFGLLIPLFMAVIGIGSLVAISRKIASAWRTAYGLTDRRVIIAVGESGETKSFGPSALARMERRGGNPRGSIVFDYGSYGEGFGYRSGLYGIEDPARVEAAIYKTLLAGSTGPTK